MEIFQGKVAFAEEIKEWCLQGTFFFASGSDRSLSPRYPGRSVWRFLDVSFCRPDFQKWLPSHTLPSEGNHQRSVGNLWPLQQPQPFLDGGLRPIRERIDLYLEQGHSSCLAPSGDFWYSDFCSRYKNPLNILQRWRRMMFLKNIPLIPFVDLRSEPLVLTLQWPLSCHQRAGEKPHSRHHLHDLGQFGRWSQSFHHVFFQFSLTRYRKWRNGTWQGNVLVNQYNLPHATGDRRVHMLPVLVKRISHHIDNCVTLWALRKMWHSIRLSLKTESIQNMDQCQYQSNQASTPPPTQHKPKPGALTCKGLLP